MRLNLVPEGARPVAVYWNIDRKEFVEVYNPLDCKAYYDNFPSTIYDCTPSDEKIANLTGLRQRNLHPRKDALAVGAMWSWQQGIGYWDLFWHESDCELSNPNLPSVYQQHFIPDGWVRDRDLYQYNLFAKDAKPLGAVWTGRDFDLLYDPKDCHLLDSSLPPVVNDLWYNERDSSYIGASKLRNEIGLKKDNLKPGKAKPKAVYYAGECALKFLHQIKEIFVCLYDPKDCEEYIKNPPPIAPDNWWQQENLLTKSSLRKRNLKPKPEVKAAYRYWTLDNEWDFLYRESDCQIDDKDLPPVVNEKPLGFYYREELKRLNRVATIFTLAAACIWQEGNEGLIKYVPPQVSGFIPLYRVEDSEILDSSLLPCYPQENLPSHLNSKWAWKQKEPLFVLKETAIATGCFQTIEKGEIVLLYDRSQLRLHNREINISKTKLKQIYRFDSEWLEKLGKPDRLQENPVNLRFKPMQVYSRNRVETFLAENAAEYVEYLEKKRKLPQVFDHLNSAIELVGEIEDLVATRTIAVGQYQKCLSCACGAVIPNGFLCTVHYQELKQIPCLDYQQK